jgi:hypothetical protein
VQQTSLHPRAGSRERYATAQLRTIPAVKIPYSVGLVDGATGELLQQHAGEVDIEQLEQLGDFDPFETSSAPALEFYRRQPPGKELAGVRVEVRFGRPLT